jgi:hypothetical protein
LAGRGTPFWRGALAFACLLAFCGQAKAQLNVHHEVVNSAYLPGRLLDITLELEKDVEEPVLALALEEQLPAGWEYQYVLDTPVIPDVFEFAGMLVFNFVNVPSLPFSMTYRVSVPAESTGTQALTVSALYRLNRGEIRMPARTDVFAEGHFALTVGTRGPGTVLPKVGTIAFIESDGIILEAVSLNEDYVFFSWEGLNASGANPLPLYVGGESSITAVFVPLRRVSIGATGGGTVSPAPGEYKFPEGETIYLTATPEAGWHFKHWEGLDTTSDPSITKTVAGNGYFLAVFEEDAGEGEGEGETGPEFSSGDTNVDSVISLSELLRAVQFFNIGGYQCANRETEDGYITGTGDTGCTAHTLDYNPQDWQISMLELLRFIQFYNSGGYYACEGTEDGFCPGVG